MELKFCRDTDPTGQLTRATVQHSKLAEALRMAAPEAEVNTEIVLVGVSGAIYTDYTKDPLLRLGLTKGEWDKLKYRIHVAAVQQLHWIHVSKLTQESVVRPGVHGPRKGAGLHYKRGTCVRRSAGEPGCTAPAHRKRKNR
jgi:hypothetical protein